MSLKTSHANVLHDLAHACLQTKQQSAAVFWPGISTGIPQEAQQLARVQRFQRQQVSQQEQAPRSRFELVLEPKRGRLNVRS